MKAQRETFEIADVPVLQVLNNPLRLRFLHQLLEPTIPGLERHFAAARQGEAEPAGTLGRTIVPMTEEDACRFAECVCAVVGEMREYDHREGKEYPFSFVFFPMVGPVKGEKLCA